MGKKQSTVQKYDMIFDTTTMRPAGLMLQASLCCNPEIVTQAGFEPHTWLNEPTDGMKRLSGTVAEWSKLALVTNKRLEHARVEQPTGDNTVR